MNAAQLIEAMPPMAWTPNGELLAPPPLSPEEEAEIVADINSGRWPYLEPLAAPPAANDNFPPVMLGLTGKRNVGKSTVAEMLERDYGFIKVHAFEAGKEAAVTWFAEITGDIDAAIRMVHGDLKDKPCASLPGCVAPRHFLERFGSFMGQEMGVDWTLALELARAARVGPGMPIVVESVVYEAGWFKRRGGVVLRLVRPGHEGPVGVSSDVAQAAVDADVTIAATSVAELLDKARFVVEGIMQQKIGGR
jgi:hypothetical protein